MKLLVPSDGSEHSKKVIAHAVGLARQLGAGELRVLYVANTSELEELPRLEEMLSCRGSCETGELMRRVEEMVDHSAAKALSHIKEEVESIPHPGLEVSFVVRKGEPAVEILEEAKSCGAEMVVMGSLRLGSRVALGSTADKVLRSAGVPVMVVGPRSELPGKVERLLVPLDHSGTSRAVLEVASRIASRLGASMELFHVVNEPVIRYFSSLSGLGEEEKSRLISEYMATARENLMELLPEDGHEAKVVTGDPVKEILREMEQGFGLVVMGTRGMGHIGRFLIGSVTGGVICQATRPVVVVRD